MSPDESHPEPDRIEGVPHPRDTTTIVGQGAAESDFLDAFNSDRLHHAWLITGPRGVGKATFAWRAARFLLAQRPGGSGGLFDEAPIAPQTLDIAPDHPVARRLQAGSEGRLFVLRRAWDDEKKWFKTVITVDEVRRMRNFLHLSATDGGHRVVIVDPADEMNTAAANSLLKMLEEPPAGVTFLIVSHQPARLLPTIRSRCRTLRLSTLGPDDLAKAITATGADVGGNETALAELAGGSVGEAIRLLNLDGIELYAAIVTLFQSLPRLDRGRALALADRAAQRKQDERFDVLIGLVDLFLSRVARAGALGEARPDAAPGEAELLRKLAPDAEAGRRWAALHQSLGARIRHGRAVNLDPAALVLDIVFKIAGTADG